MCVDVTYMNQALQLAHRGAGHVEPNPMVGCVIVRDGQILGEGFHAKFGADHAEVNALADVRQSGRSPIGATMYVTLEPCCHQGKTPPCTSAIIDAKISRVVVAVKDPFSEVCGQGIQILRQAGIEVTTGVAQTAALELIAPFTMLLTNQRPWIIAKWAMTLDGKIATKCGDSQWISCSLSRGIVHRLRGRVDGILVGSATAQTDDPLLTARPPGPRTATRIVLDRGANLSLHSRLVKSAAATPVIVATSSEADNNQCDRLRTAGCEILSLSGASQQNQLHELLQQLGARQMTNILVEGGGQVLGSLMDAQLIDEVHVFIAPKLVGGSHAVTPMAGTGIASMSEALNLRSPEIQTVGSDIYVRGRTHSPSMERA